MALDMHCHLDLFPEPTQVVKECEKRGTYVLSVTTTPKAWYGTKALAKGKSRIRTSLGLHPQLAPQRANELDLFEAILPEAKYVGEIGLDGRRGFKEHWDIQLKVFRHVLQAVNRAGGRIMTVHSSGGVEAVVEEVAKIDSIPILHWFTGSHSQLNKAIDVGCWFSVGPAMLKTQKGSEIARRLPKERILTETDGPFAKLSGAPLYPWDVDVAIHQLASLWKCSYPEAKSIILENFKKLVSY